MNAQGSGTAGKPESTLKKPSTMAEEIDTQKPSYEAVDPASSSSPVLPTVAPWIWHSMATEQPEPPRMTREVLVVVDGASRGVPDTIAVGWRMINSAGQPTGWWQVNGRSCKEDMLKCWAELPTLPLASFQGVPAAAGDSKSNPTPCPPLSASK